MSYQAVGFAYQGSSFAYQAAGADVAATLSGTLVTANEPRIVSTGGTLIITLTNDTWVAAGATFDAQRQAIINGLDSDGVEVAGWNAQVRDSIAVTTVVRTSATVVTITVPARPSYAINSTETVTVTVPGSALTLALPLTATPDFEIIPAITYGAGKKHRGISLGLRIGV
jgi:hypothetical protein